MLSVGLNSTSAFGRGRVAGLDPDAQTYISAVETADGEELESGVKTAINDFVVGCKGDAIWDALKASCILAGARTLNGALVPLAGTAPTNVNFVSEDYNRKTGLKGNGSTKYLNSNRANNDDPQDNNHNAVWVTAATAISDLFNCYAGSGGVWQGANNLGFTTNVPAEFARSRNRNFDAADSTAASTGLIAISRSTASQFTLRRRETDKVLTRTSETLGAANLYVFARENGSGAAEAHTDARMSFYSAGTSIDLASLDARVSALMTAIDGAIA